MKIGNLSDKFKSPRARSFFNVVFFLCIFVFCFSTTSYTLPKSSFAADSLVKILQAKGWVESGFQSQTVHYLGKSIDPAYKYFLIDTSTSRSGEKITPFPFANTIITAPFVAFGFPEGIIYLSAFIFFLYLILLLRITKLYLTPIATIFGTPLLHHFISFSDVSIAATLVLFGITFLLTEDMSFNKNQPRLFISGALMGIACWYRPEVIILTSCFLFSNFLIPLIKTKTIEKEVVRRSFVFSFGFLILFSAFIAYNWVHYDSILGPRVESNRSILLFDWPTKFGSIRSLLINGNGRVGLFGYSAWYLFVIGFCLWNWTKIRETSQIWIITFLTNLTLVCIFTPNDSNIDWGSRYFTCSAFVPLLLLKEFQQIKIGKPIFQKFFLSILGILILYSLNINHKVIRTMRRISLQLTQIQSSIPWSESKVFVTHRNNIANTFGLNYLNQTILLLSSVEDLNKVVLENQKVNFVLIEDVTDNSLSKYAREHFQDRYSITEIRKERIGLIQLTEMISGKK
ncbi:LA_3751/LA_3752 family putative glycosyltransferase [Leptospira stimsonii]|uniref:Glycosyltransferase RgtA/B/C/D-like domain-containing protein n=1 Tax=Leptospira stimsonii TaxID=2202203 RepID=A0A8B3CPD4_9LEPT|nr:hypothetical protein DLM78_13890 [Leptospira stimsonii]